MGKHCEISNIFQADKIRCHYHHSWLWLKTEHDRMNLNKLSKISNNHIDDAINQLQNSSVNMFNFLKIKQF